MALIKVLHIWIVMSICLRTVPISPRVRVPTDDPQLGDIAKKISLLRIDNRWLKWEKFHDQARQGLADIEARLALPDLSAGERSMLEQQRRSLAQVISSLDR